MITQMSYNKTYLHLAISGLFGFLFQGYNSFYKKQADGVYEEQRGKDRVPFEPGSPGGITHREDAS